MSVVRKLQQGDSGTSLDLTTDIPGGNNGWSVEAWNLQIAAPWQKELITETIDCIVQGSSQDDLASRVQSMAEMARFAELYINDPMFETPVWLHAQAENETNERRSLVHRIEMTERSPSLDTSGDIADSRMKYRLEVTREPFWEATSASPIPERYLFALGFDSGSTEFTIGETITGNTSTDEGVVMWYNVTSGNWGTDDAAGTVYYQAVALHDYFNDNEEINGSSGGNNMATANGTAEGTIATLYDYTESANVEGDTSARIFSLAFVAVNPTGRIWVGIRSDDKSLGNASEFIPVWELEDGAQEDTDATLQTDGSNSASPYSGSGNDHIQVTEGTSGTDWDDGSLHKVWSIAMSNVTLDNESSQFGLLKWLLRYKVGSSTEWRIQLRLGYTAMTDADFIKMEQMDLNSTSWDFIEGGVQMLPLRNLQAIPLSVVGDFSEGSTEIQIWAKRVSGSNDLYLDCLCPIPVDEGYLNFDFTDKTGDYFVYGKSPHGHPQCATYDGASLIMSEFSEYDTNNFNLPPGGGRLVIVRSQAAQSNIEGIIKIGLLSANTFYERWLSLRGSE